jgi:hypothetical protein
MDIIHHIAYWDSWNKPLKKQLELEHIKYKVVEDPTHKDDFISFDVSESHPYWKQISKLQKGLIGRIKYGDIPDTYFSETEIRNAEWSRLMVENVKKYPQPYATWVTNPVNYDDFCRNCGTHVQARPFRIQAETKWGYFHFFTFFWGHAIFARKMVFDAIQRNHLRGVTRMNLLIRRNGEPAKDIFQLVPANTTRGGFLLEKYIKTSRCRKCGTRKFSYHNRGVMRYKRDPLMEDVDILYTQEWFGVGRKDANHEVLISNRFARLILDGGWKGVSMKAVEVV